jgi:flagellar basal body-associated protein FliL
MTEKPAETAELTGIPPLDPTQDAHSYVIPAPRLKEYFTSTDAPSRYLILLSSLFAFLAVCSFSLLIFYTWKHRHAEQKTPVATTVESIGEASFNAALGQFKVQWDDGELSADLTAECTTEEACKALKDRYDQTHDSILPLLQASSRTEILNPARKLRLRQAIADKLNELKLNGRVVQIDFTDLTVEPRK